jgi:hypothetical protein
MSLEHSPGRQGGRAVYSVAEFCNAHDISRAKLYQLWDEGAGPRVMRIGTRILISIEAAAAWRAQLENDFQAKTAAAEAV